MDDMNNGSKIDYKTIVSFLKNNLKGILLWAILGLVVSFVVSFFYMEPKYSSTIDILVNQKANDTQEQYTAQQADLQAITTYKDILQKGIILGPVLNNVKDQDNYKGNLSDLKNSISVNNETNSQVMSVTVKDTNSYVAADIANQIGSVFTKKIKKMMKVDNVTIVSKGKANPKPVSPNVKLLSVIGMIVGMFVGVIISVSRESLDKSVKDEEFLKEDLGLINLGNIYHQKIDERKFGVIRALEKKDSNTYQGKRRV